MRFLLFSLLVLKTTIIQTQTPEHVWLNAGNVSARITPTGIHADSSGGFLLGSSNLLSHLTPWIGGFDPAWNLTITHEMNDHNKSKWKPGFKNIPNSGKVWKVTLDQIKAHLADFWDNGNIDHPIPEVFAWPGYGNFYSLEYNGFELPTTQKGYFFGPFYDYNEDGIYSPQFGEYPTLGINLHDRDLSPLEMTFSTFYDTINFDHNPYSLMNTVGRFQAFSYACDDPLAANSIFISYKFNHSFDDIFRSDSSYYSIYIDPDIGNPKDDYLGTGKDFLYAYNSDTLQDEILDVHPPMLGIHFLKGPMDTFGNYISLSHVMPMVFDTNLIQAINPPEHDVEYYRYMSGSWKDGLPLNSGDFGYSNDSIVNFPFPDHPTNSLGWSELAAQNPLADRRAVASFGPTTLLTGSTNHLLVGLYASNEVGPTSQLEEMQKRKQLFTWHFNGGWHSYDKPVYLCPNPNSAFLYKRPLLAIVKLFPNPAKESFRVAVFGHWLLHVSICDQHQRVIYEQDLESLDFEFSTKGLPPGIYFVNCVLSNGERIIEKVIVNL